MNHSWELVECKENIVSQIPLACGKAIYIGQTAAVLVGIWGSMGSRPGVVRDRIFRFIADIMNTVHVRLFLGKLLS